MVMLPVISIGGPGVPGGSAGAAASWPQGGVPVSPVMVVPGAVGPLNISVPARVLGGVGAFDSALYLDLVVVFGDARRS